MKISRMSQILTREAFENAIRVNAAIGGSTNAVMHLLALAGRMGVPLTLDDFDAGSRRAVLVNLQPSGEFLMEDFYYAGGLPAVLRELASADPSRRADRERQDDRRQHRGRAVLESRGHHARSRSRSSSAPGLRCCAAISRRMAR